MDAFRAHYKCIYFLTKHSYKRVINTRGLVLASSASAAWCRVASSLIMASVKTDSTIRNKHSYCYISSWWNLSDLLTFQWNNNTTTGTVTLMLVIWQGELLTLRSSVQASAYCCRLPNVTERYIAQYAFMTDDRLDKQICDSSNQSFTALISSQCSYGAQNQEWRMSLYFYGCPLC